MRKATRLFLGCEYNPECQSGIKTVPMDDCRQQWVVVDDHEDIYMMLEDRLTALGYGMLKANNEIEGIIVLPVVACGMSWDSEFTEMNGLSLLSELHINFCNTFYGDKT